MEIPVVEKQLIIHATNVTGYGAAHVVSSFLDSASKLGYLKDATIYLPSFGPLKDYNLPSLKVKRFERIFPNNLSRMVECLFSWILFPKNSKFMVLGDIPLRGIKDQLVLVHQPNIIYPKYDPRSSKSFVYRVFRFLFKINCKYAGSVVVQTQVMADNLLSSYPALSNKIYVVPQPVPEWFKLQSRTVHNSKKLTLFYPAAAYLHKNHSFLHELAAYKAQYGTRVDFVIIITISDNQFQPFKHLDFVVNVGHLAPSEVLEYYRKTDVLLFMSLMESYGLPLVEAITIGLPIMCVDLPYARWMCENSAYYFHKDSAKEFFSVLENVNDDKLSKTLPDYSTVVSKFPKSWEEVVGRFFNLIHAK